MAWTAADLAALDAAMASGARMVRYPDGSSIEYRSLDEMQRVRAQIAAVVSPPAPGLTNRAVMVRL